MKEGIVRLDQRILDKVNADPFAVQTLAKKFQVGYEYLVNGEWVDGPPSQRPERRRIVFEGANNPRFQGRERFRAARDIYFAWKSIADASVYEPVNKEVIIDRLFYARTGGPDILEGTYDYTADMGNFRKVVPGGWLFTPWGVRTEGQFGNPELAVLDIIQSFQKGLRKRDLPIGVLIMPADIYATEINRQVTPFEAAKYFASVREAAEGKGFLVQPWSQIRSELTYNMYKGYKARAAELTRKEIYKLVGRNVVEGAKKTAEKRSGYQKDTEVVNATYAYLRERICEAERIENAYMPIKLSAVAKGKDNGVDRDLPRIYVIPPELQFPWLK